MSLAAITSCRDVAGVSPHAFRADVLKEPPQAHYSAVFLAPLGGPDVQRGLAETALSPEVRICQWQDGRCTEAPVAVFSRESLGESRLRSSAGTAGFYSAEWHTGVSHVVASATYQIAVWLNGRVIGRTYVEVRGDGATDGDDAPTLVAGQTLPIRFRIEDSPFASGDSTLRLVVALGRGVAGSPGVQDSVYRQGARVHYQFDAVAGFENVLVSIDGHPAKTHGMIIMDGPHLLQVGADTAIAPPLASDTLYREARALLTATQSVEAFEEYGKSIAALARTAGEDELSRRVAVADYLAFDPVRDGAALERLDSTLAGHVFYAEGAADSGAPRSVVARSEVTGPQNPTAVFFVNGILNTPSDELKTLSVLTQLVRGSAASNVTRVGAIYNRTITQQITPADRRTRLCMQDFGRARPFLSDLSLDLRFSKCMGSFYYLYNFDLSECFRQVMQLSGAGAFPPEADAKTVADTVLHYMDDVKQNVILVPHSQGNLMTEQALNVVHADPRFQNGAGRCLSVASIAAPTSRGWSLEEGRDLWAFIINHDVLDALLHMNTFQHIDTPLSRRVDAELAYWRNLAEHHVPGAGIMLNYKIVSQGLAIHSATDSYMSAASPESRTLLRENIETLATRNCHRSYALVGNYFASDPQYGCFSPLYIRVTERGDGSVWIDQWDWGYNSGFHGAVASKGGSYAYTAHVLYSNRATNPEWLEEDYTWNMVLTPRPDGTYLGEVDATLVERASWRSWTYKSACTTELTRTYD